MNGHDDQKRDEGREQRDSNRQAYARGEAPQLDRRTDEAKDAAEEPGPRKMSTWDDGLPGFRIRSADKEGADVTGLVVGIDGSEHADRALLWAWEEAVSRGVGLTVVNAWDAGWSGLPSSIMSVDEETFKVASASELRVLSDAVKRMQENTGVDTSRVHMVERRGATVTTLIEEAQDSPMIVVGRRGLGRLGRWVMGSVSTGVVRQSHVPVTVIPAGWTPLAEAKTSSGRIVVGVDGSPASLVALRQAFEVARRTGERVEAVACWQIMTTGFLPGQTGWAPPLEDYHMQVSAMLDDALKGVAASEGALPDEQVEAVVVHAQPARGLLMYAGGATRLIVGHRGLGGFDRLLLGSVSSQVLEHAPCPVTVVRD